MGLNDTGTVNDEGDAGAGNGRAIKRDAGDTGPLNPNSTEGTHGYHPVRLGDRAMADRVSYNKTKVEIRPRKEPEVSGVGVEGAFYTMRTVADAVDPDDNGDIYLQGGMVSGGTGNVVIADIKLYDASSTTWVGTDGQTLIVTVAGTGQATSGILDPVFNVATAVASIAAVGTNSLPEVGATSGTLYLLLGSYFEGGFAPSGAGNFHISFCYGAYTISRT